MLNCKNVGPLSPSNTVIIWADIVPPRIVFCKDFENSESNEGNKSAKLRKCASWAGTDGYPKVLNYSIFKSLLEPNSKSFTIR